MISGLHAIVFSSQPEQDRAFLRDILAFTSVDAGDGWLVFAMPPTELAVHPGDEARCELYLMCDDIHAAVETLSAKGVEFSRSVSDEGWGLLTALTMPSGSELGLYEPRHPLAHA